MAKDSRQFHHADRERSTTAPNATQGIQRPERRRENSDTTAKDFEPMDSPKLGMGKIIEEDALRRPLSATPETEGVTWLDSPVRDSACPDWMPARCWT